MKNIEELLNELLTKIIETKTNKSAGRLSQADSLVNGKIGRKASLKARKSSKHRRRARRIFTEEVKAGTVIDAVAVAGGDLTRIDSISFSVDDTTGYYAEAREKAVADAEAKAKQLAEVAGVKLGKAVYVSESSYVPGPIYRQDLIAEKAAGAPAVETPISPGEMEITLNVQLAYAILD